ncbi:MAG: DMT family transporter [Proteobacteria bacterium]|nr:DMT family transporter [Pseudomonadota bacterium]
MNPYRLGLLLTALSAIAWSTAGYFTTLIGLDNWSLLLWRGLIGALGLLAFMGLTRGHRTFTDFHHLGTAGWLYAIISAIGMLCFITSLTLTSVAHVAVIYGTAPFIAAGAGWLLLRAVPTRHALIAAALALLGVLVMVLPGLEVQASLAGDLLALGMTLSLALLMTIAKRCPGIPTLAAATLSAALSALGALPFTGEAAAYTQTTWIALILFGLVNSALGLALFTLGARLLPPIETALIGALDAPLAPIWVWLAFGIRPDAATLAGGLIVFGAVLAHILGQRQRALC